MHPPSYGANQSRRRPLSEDPEICPTVVDISCASRTYRQKGKKKKKRNKNHTQTTNEAADSLTDEGGRVVC